MVLPPSEQGPMDRAAPRCFRAVESPRPRFLEAGCSPAHGETLVRVPPLLPTEFRQKILDHSGPRKGVYAVEARIPLDGSNPVSFPEFLSVFGFRVQPHLKMKLWD